MAFKEVQDLDADVTIALGGVNKKTGKPNPKQVEGYYIGARKVESNKAKSGFCSLHIFQTAKGNVGVWGKTDLDRKLSNTPVGAMVRATCTGMQAIPGKNDMYKYKVEIDADNTIEVNLSQNSTGDAEDVNDSTDAYVLGDDEYSDETSLDSDDTALDEIQAARPKTATRPVDAGAARAKRVQDLLNSRKAAS